MQYNDCVWCVWQSTGCSYCRTGWLVFHEPWKAVVRKEAVAALKAIWCTLFQEGRKVAAVLGLLGPLSDTYELSACSMIGSSWIWGNDPFGVCRIPGAPDICAWPAWQSKSVKIQHVPGSFGILWDPLGTSTWQIDLLLPFARGWALILYMSSQLDFLLMLRSYLTTYKDHPRQILDHS